MKKEDYIELLKKEDYNALANISFISDLLTTEYENKTLAEYLLEKGIHSESMDNYVKYHLDLGVLYLKYNITKPLLNSSFKVLFTNYNGNLIIDLILDRINDDEKIELYNNLKTNSYSNFHDNEREIIDIYLRHGIVLPIVFAKTHLNEEVNYELSDDDQELINEFRGLFKDHEQKFLSFIINELKRSLLKNHDRTVNDIKKMIKLKQENPEFIFINSGNKGGESYDNETKQFITSPTEPVMFEHELSHLLYESFETLSDDTFSKYKELTNLLDNEETLNKIKIYLEKFHKEHEGMKNYFKNLYYKKIDEIYGSFDNYLDVVCKDMLNSKTFMFELWNHERGTTSFYMVSEFNIRDIVLEFLTIEREEFIRINLRKYFAPELMLENMLDAILRGKVFDEELDIHCLSGHGSLYFSVLETRSFDECLANYDAIKKSVKSDKLIDDLNNLIGLDLLNFLDNYIKKNREGEYGHR